MKSKRSIPDRVVVVVDRYKYLEHLQSSGTQIYTELLAAGSHPYLCFPLDDPDSCEYDHSFYLCKSNTLTPETLPSEGSVVVLELTGYKPTEWGTDCHGNYAWDTPIEELYGCDRLWKIVTD